MSTGPGQMVGVRLHKGHLEILDAWIAEHSDYEAISQPEAIRRLILTAGRGAPWMKAHSAAGQLSRK